MKTIVLDGNQMITPDKAKTYIGEKLPLNVKYDKYLNNLYENLATIKEDVEVVVVKPKTISAIYKNFWNNLLDVFIDAPIYNPHIKVIIQ